MACVGARGEAGMEDCPVPLGNPGIAEAGHVSEGPGVYPGLLHASLCNPSVLSPQHPSYF